MKGSLSGKLRSLWRYRPRVFSLLLFSLISTTLLLANLSIAPPDGTGRIRYGWPLIWHWHSLRGSEALVTCFGSLAIESWNYDWRRLAANAGLWFLMAAIPSMACEYLLRRFKLKWRWGLRTMLIGVAVIAALCAWLAAARQRASVQDELIASINGRTWIARSGPQWLDLLGFDCYRRYITGAHLDGTLQENGEQDIEELLERLAKLPTLRYLFLVIDRLTPRIAAALDNMPRLTVLSISAPLAIDDAGAFQNCVKAIGKMTDLEFLEIHGQARMTLPPDSLAGLARLTRLKALVLDSIAAEPQKARTGPFILECLPALPHVERLDLRASQIGDGDLVYLALLPRLKIVNLCGTKVTAAGLEQLAVLASLEELSLGGDAASPVGVESLAAIERIKKLHLDGWNMAAIESAVLPSDDELLGSASSELAQLAALQTLRRAKPGIAIDGNAYQEEWLGTSLIPGDQQSLPFRVWHPAAGLPWVSPVQGTR